MKMVMHYKTTKFLAVQVNDNGVQLWGSDRVGQGLDSIATDSEVSTIEWDPDTLKPQML